MGYTVVALKEKIMEMYPEIEKNGILVGLVFSEEKNAYVVNFRKGKHLLSTHLEKKDADDCLDNIKCIYLGGQIGQFIKNFAGDQPPVPEMQMIECCGYSACVDNEGYLLNFHDWNESIAVGLAEKEGIKGLTEQQFDILKFVRNHYEQYNYFPIIKSICKNLHQDKDCVSEKFMTPAMVWKLAGLPKPDAVIANLLEHNEPPT
jgi:TusE/DsrC/DsvC family sulfur relay protein